MTKKSGEESLKIKTAIKSFFRTRNCFNAVEGNKGHYHRLVEYIQQVTPTKAVFGKNLSGPILCSMIQIYVSRLQKKRPAVIQSAFNRAVAAESRKTIERLYVDYLEKMAEIEEKIPCTEAELYQGHEKLSQELMQRFDEQMADFIECEEIIFEKETISQRIQGYYEELKESNVKKSEENSRALFQKLFKVCKEDEEVAEKITEVEGDLLNAVSAYYEQAVGPAAYQVFVEEIVVVFPFFCGAIREASQQIENGHDDLAEEVEILKKSREKSRQNEKKLQVLLDETIKNYEAQLESKEKALNELQISCATRINISENKTKNLTRELKSVQQELEQTLKEKESALEIEREIYSQKMIEYETLISRLRSENNRIERENEEIQILHESSLSAKEDELIELKQRGKLSETITESNQDCSILYGLKQDLSEIFTQFKSEQENNAKLVGQMDKIASLQNELNKFRLKEIENKNKIVDEYEDKIGELKDENERLLKELAEAKTKKNFCIESGSEIEEAKKKVALLEEEVRRKNEKFGVIEESLSKRDDQIQNLYGVIEVHKKQFENLASDFEDREGELHRIKIENAQLVDDNDILIGLMGYSLEVLQKKRNIQAINLAQVQNQTNRNRVIKIFKKFGIPFD